MRDMTPEEYEDLVASEHQCHEGCIDSSHRDLPDPHRHALESAGWRGSIGSREQVSRDLWRRAGELLGDQADPADARALIEQGEIYRRLLEEWEDQQLARLVLWEAKQATLRAQARWERRCAAAARRQQPRKDTRSPNRPTRVDVHPEAWTILKQRAIKLQRPVAAVVGKLIVEAPLPKHPLPLERTRTKRFARLFIQDSDWLLLRADAEQFGITVALLIGLTVEAEAVRLGWRPGDER